MKPSFQILRFYLISILLLNYLNWITLIKLKSNNRKENDFINPLIANQISNNCNHVFK